MKYADKYKPMYFPAPAGYNKWMEKDHIEQPPIWCSVDLRDGNPYEFRRKNRIL